MSEDILPDASSLFQETLPIHPDIVISQLVGLKIPIEKFHHPPLNTVSESKKCRYNMLTKNDGGGHIKNFYLRDHKKNNYLVVLQEDKTVDLKKLSLLMQSGRLSFGSADRLFENLGVRPGAVTPLAMITGVRKGVKFFIDSELFEVNKVYMHPLVNDFTISMTPSELEYYLEFLGVYATKLNL